MLRRQKHVLSQSTTPSRAPYLCLLVFFRPQITEAAQGWKVQKRVVGDDAHQHLYDLAPPAMPSVAVHAAALPCVRYLSLCVAGASAGISGMSGTCPAYSFGHTG